MEIPLKLIVAIFVLTGIITPISIDNALESKIEHFNNEYVLVLENSIQAIPDLTPQVSWIVSRVIQCESNWNHYDRHGNILVGDRHYIHHAYGIAQFQMRTFDWLKGLAGMPHLSIYSEQDQIWLLDWAIKNGHGNLWTCYRRI